MSTVILQHKAMVFPPSFVIRNQDKGISMFFILAQRHLVAGSWILCISRLNIWVAVLFLGLALIGTRLEEAWPFPDSNHCNDSSFAACRLDVFYQSVLFG